MLKQPDDTWNTNLISVSSSTPPCAETSNGSLLNWIKSKLQLGPALCHCAPVYTSHLSSFSSSFCSPPYVPGFYFSVVRSLCFCCCEPLRIRCGSFPLYIWASLGMLHSECGLPWTCLALPLSHAVSLSHVAYICSSYHQCITYLMVCDSLCIRKSALWILFVVLMLRAACYAMASKYISFKWNMKHTWLQSCPPAPFHFSEPEFRGDDESLISCQTYLAVRN